MKVQIPKGTFDILPYGAEEPWQLSDLWQYAESIIRQTAADYGYREIRTPVYERTELFQRGVGETTDIVMKEMFTFEDRSQRSLSLRPEGTASVARAFVEHHLSQLGATHKFFYIGPMFRYERPQSGRYRQHHQFGVEAYGIASPEQDAEVIDLLIQVYQRLGLKHLKVHVNTVGDLESRRQYREALLHYLRPHFDALSADSQARFEKNPLRILDSKDPKDREIVQSAPSILNHLTPAAKEHFQILCHLLDQIGVPYEVNDRIVRGLDYYQKTVFEVLTQDLGAQNTIGAGGRYDGLIGQFSGPDLPAVGFATGLERILQVMLAQNVPTARGIRPLVYFIPIGEEARQKCFTLATLCRHNHIAADVDVQAKKVPAAIQNGCRAEAKYACIIGSDELKSGHAKLKDLTTREEHPVVLEQLLKTLNHL
ncbi:MAG TPA: histidine--tRNA ligase [Chlamydiales bacterium]|jgi:histidyl-tRNA synthetase|nr:histidine--tRNA ligase [Chlamydiales bacterium]